VVRNVSAPVVPAAPSRLSPASRTDQLVAAGLVLVKRMPFDQVSAVDVAREAGVSKALVFHYFPTTGDLHAAILRAAADELLEAIDVDPTLAPGERLMLGLDTFVTYLEQQPASYAVMSRSAGGDPRLLAVFEETRASTVALIQSALGTDELSPGLRIALRGWIAMVEESVLHWLDGRPVPREDLVSFLYETAVAMLTVTAPPSFHLKGTDLG